MILNDERIAIAVGVVVEEKAVVLDRGIFRLGRAVLVG